MSGTRCFRWTTISIHAAREGGDATDKVVLLRDPLFQSTPPVKAATGLSTTKATRTLFQSTPPVKAATVDNQLNLRAALFQSTPPVKAATA